MQPGQRTRTFYLRDEQLICSVKGDLEVKLLTSYQSILIKNDYYAQGEESPVNESDIDMFDIDESRFPDSNMAFIYPLLLNEGDCLYLPAYWWQQIEGDQKGTSIAVSYWYEISSEWLKLIFTGIENNHI